MTPAPKPWLDHRGLGPRAAPLAAATRVWRDFAPSPKEVYGEA